MATLNWIGKEAVVNHDKEVPFKLLEKVPGASVGKESKNLVIHGDNLEALKALVPFYGGKVDCIYIDPPYNTGTEGWIYNDRVNSPKIKEWLGKVVGGDSEDLARHDKWLCMMYPRLVLLRQLLSSDGVIFVSIDENEVHNLLYLMEEIFKHNIGIFSWVRKKKGSHLSSSLRKMTEYVVAYTNSSRPSGQSKLVNNKSRHEWRYSPELLKEIGDAFPVKFREPFEFNNVYALLSGFNVRDVRLWATQFLRRLHLSEPGFEPSVFETLHEYFVFLGMDALSHTYKRLSKYPISKL